VTSTWKVGTVAAIHAETPTARTLELDVPDWPGNLAGQHLDLRLTAPDGYTATRSYSIASADSGPRVQLAVDRLPDGEVSPYLVNDVIVGDELEVRGPLGGWFVWRPEQTEPVQLIGGGSGIVPLMAMIRAHAAAGSTARFRLLYSVREPGDAFFAAELAELERSSDHLEITWVYTRKTPDGWPTPAGRVTPAILEASTISAAENPTVFVCGPTGFVEAVADILVELGHSSGSVKTERFGGA
jgi:ferredoxin-NADP reductase